MGIYFLKIARITLKIAPTTTTHPAITVTLFSPGITKVLSIIPEPTARDTKIPTIHAKIPISEFSSIFLPPIYLVILF